MWIPQTKQIPAIIYQLEALGLTGLLGGHYFAGEELSGGLRGVKEELGKNYKKEELTCLGRKMNVSPDVNGKMRKNF